MNRQHIEALKVLSAYTAGSFDIWRLSGPSKASCRAHVMSLFNGRKTPQREAGVTNMREAFHMLAFNENALDFKAAECLAMREAAFQAWAHSIVHATL